MAKRTKRNGSKNEGEGLQEEHPGRQKVGQACRIRKRVTSRKGVSTHTQEASPAVATAVIDVVDEPIPDVMRVTEIEETRVTLPDPDAPMSRDIPEPDSLGG